MKYNNLLIEYKVLVKVNASTAATEFIAMFIALLDGYLALVENVSNEVAKIQNTLVADKLTRLNNIEKYHNGYCPDRAIQLEMVNLMRPIIAARRVTKTEPSKAVDKSYWQYDEEDLLTVTDPARLNSIVNNYASALAKESKPTLYASAVAYFGNGNEEVAVAKLNALRVFARARQKELSTVKISASLQAKLDKGSKAVLSASDIAELQAFLKASNK